MLKYNKILNRNKPFHILINFSKNIVRLNEIAEARTGLILYRQTASNYLKQLEEIEVLNGIKIGRQKYHVKKIEKF